MKKLFQALSIITIFIIVFSKIVIKDEEIMKDTTIENNAIEEVIEEKQENEEQKELQVNLNSNSIHIDVLLVEDNKVIELGLEDYVKGVVAAEMPAEFELEALKAQAVAARTYIIAHLEEFGGASNPVASKCGANVTDDVNCQVYMSKEARFQGWPESKGEGYWDKISDAVESTSGQVLTYNGELVLAPYYFSTSAGKTQDAVDVFSKDLPYLKSVVSNGEEDAPKYQQEYIFNNSYIVSIIEIKYSDTGLTNNNLSSQMKIKDRSDSGYVNSVQIGNSVMTGAEFRNLFKLNSSYFEFEFANGKVKITTKGYGHGVGMSQWGADARAEEGMTYDQILKHYYTGIEIGVLQE